MTFPPPNKQTYTHMGAHAHMYTETYRHTNTHTHMDAYTHTHIHTYIHTHIHTYVDVVHVGVSIATYETPMPFKTILKT